MNLTKELNIYFNIFTFKYSKEQLQQILLGKKEILMSPFILILNLISIKCLKFVKV